MAKGFAILGAGMISSLHADALKKSIKGREYIDYNVDKVVRYMNCPCKIQKDIKLLAEGLRKAGLPAK